MEPYLVLARKYRPALFSEVIGQSHVVKTLNNAFKQGRLAHAYLFSGPRGVGKTTMARLLAKAFNCAQGPCEEPCNNCDYCHEISAGNSLDVFEIDGASNNSVDDIRTIRENVQYSSSKSRYKIYIIDEVHMLSTSAFNALLKTLEEPPAHIIFIFATTEVHKIPVTIISRCQHFEFKLLSVNEIMDSCQEILAKEKIQITKPALRMIARAADGSLRDSQSILEQVINVADGSIELQDVQCALGAGDPTMLRALIGAIIAGDLSQALISTDHIACTGYNLYQLCKDLIAYCRNALICKSVEKPQDIIDLSDDELRELKKIIREASIEQIEFCLMTLTDMENTVKWSSNPRFILETIITKISRFEQLVPLQSILKKLNQMEQSLAGSPMAELSGLQSTPKPVSIQSTPKPVSMQSTPKPVSIQPPQQSLPVPESAPTIVQKPPSPAEQKKDSGPTPSETVDSSTERKKLDIMTDMTENQANSDTIQKELPQEKKQQLKVAAQTKKPRKRTNLTSDEVTNIWQDVVKRIQQDKRSLATILENVYLISLTEDEICLGIAENDSLTGALLEEKQNQTFITRTIEAITEYKTRLTVSRVPSTKGFQSLRDQKTAQKQAHFQELKQAALKHDMVQQTIDLFEGTVAQITEKKHSKGE